MIKTLLGIILCSYLVIQFVMICVYLNITDEGDARHMKSKKWFRKPKHMMESE